MDAWLMPIFRAPGEPILGFYLGCAALALVCVVLGDLTVILAMTVNRKRFESVIGEMVKLNNWTVNALEAGDGDSYRAANKLANEAFGQAFFLQLTLSAASLWPIPLAMAWMQHRFGAVDFVAPIVNANLNYFGPFIFIYVLVRIVYGRVRRRIPFLRRGAELAKAISDQAGPMRRWSELFEVPSAPKRG
jgi:hypothetical protein